MMHFLKALSLLFCFVAFANVKHGYAIDRLVVSVNQYQITIGQTFEMLITANGVAEERDIDLSSLEKDYELISVTFDKYSYRVNKQLSNNSSWILRLKPKSTGELIIPPVKLDQAVSYEEYIEVISIEDSNEAEPALQVVTEITTNESILGRDLLYTVTVYQQQEIERKRIYQLFPPEIKFQQLGKDEHVLEYQAGQPYRYMRRRYILQPQRVGDFEIPAPIFTGVAVERNRGNFGRIYSTRYDVSASGKSSQLQVNAIPSLAQDTQLFALDVKYEASWQNTSFSVGSANLLTITLSVLGATPSQINDLILQAPTGLRAYDESVQQSMQIADNQLLTKVIKTVAIVPSQSGEFLISPMQLDWYSIDQQAVMKTELSFDPVLVPQVASNVITKNAPSNLITDFRVYLTLSILIIFIYILHVRWLLRQIGSKPDIDEQMPADNDLSIQKVIKEKDFKALNKALKIWLDEQLGYQPSLTHHQRSEQLQLVVPELCELIKIYFDNFNRNKFPDTTYFDRLSRVIKTSEASLKKSVKNNKTAQNAHYLYAHNDLGRSN